MLMGGFLRIIIVVGAILMAEGTIATATDLTLVEPGARIRASIVQEKWDYYGAKNITGIVFAAADTSISLETNSGESFIVLARQDLENLEVKVQSGGKSMGALKGFGVGAVAGGLMGFASGDDPAGMMSMTAEGKAAFGAVLMGSLGALIGTLSAPGEQWETVSDSQWQLMFGSNGRGKHGLAVAWNF
jgi:hypothetical protein